MTELAHFPHLEEPVADPGVQHYFDAAMFLHAKARTSPHRYNPDAILANAARFARVARMLGWQPRRQRQEAA
jgi:hypothetical protein